MQATTEQERRIDEAIQRLKDQITAETVPTDAVYDEFYTLYENGDVADFWCNFDTDPDYDVKGVTITYKLTSSGPGFDVRLEVPSA